MKEKWEWGGREGQGGRTNGRKEEVEEKEIGEEERRGRRQERDGSREERARRGNSRTLGKTQQVSAGKLLTPQSGLLGLSLGSDSKCKCVFKWTAEAAADFLSGPVDLRLHTFSAGCGGFHTQCSQKKKKAANSLPKINTNTYLTLDTHQPQKNRSNHTLITV